MLNLSTRCWNSASHVAWLWAVADSQTGTSAAMSSSGVTAAPVTTDTSTSTDPSTSPTSSVPPVPRAAMADSVLRLGAGSGAVYFKATSAGRPRGLVSCTSARCRAEAACWRDDNWEWADARRRKIHRWRYGHVSAQAPWCFQDWLDRMEWRVGGDSDRSVYAELSVMRRGVT